MGSPPPLGCIPPPPPSPLRVPIPPPAPSMPPNVPGKNSLFYLLIKNYSAQGKPEVLIVIDESEDDMEEDDMDISD